MRYRIWVKKRIEHTVEDIWDKILYPCPLPVLIVYFAFMDNGEGQR